MGWDQWDGFMGRDIPYFPGFYVRFEFDRGEFVFHQKEVYHYKVLKNIGYVECSQKNR